MLTRAAYLNRIRRAFLLRVHPDRFRHHQAKSIRQTQAKLVQALSNRLSQPDVQQWSSSMNHVTTTTSNNHGTNNKNHAETSSCSYSYVMEQRDGTLFQGTLHLQDHRCLQDILHDMTEALRQCGAGASLPPSLPPSTAQQQRQQHGQQPSDGARHDPGPGGRTGTTTTTTRSTNNMDRYNVISNQGRDLWQFVQRLSSRTSGGFHQNSHHNNTNNNQQQESSSLREQIRQRQLARTNAQAAALAVRRLYQFQAVDAVTLLGWSSATVTRLLQRLLELHNEHVLGVATASAATTTTTQSQVKSSSISSRPFLSFYPLRLVFSPSCAVALVRPCCGEDDGEEEEEANLSKQSQPRQQPSSTSTDSNPKQTLASSSSSSSLDVYGGILYLHPASTSLQWLDILRHEVTPRRLAQVQDCRTKLEQYKRELLQQCNWKLIKGFTCTSRDYFQVVQQLWLWLWWWRRRQNDNKDNNKDNDHRKNTNQTPKQETLQALEPNGLVGASSSSTHNNHHDNASSSSLWTLEEPLNIKVESPQTACHGNQKIPSLTREGTIMLCRSMVLGSDDRVGGNNNDDDDYFYSYYLNNHVNDVDPSTTTTTTTPSAASTSTTTNAATRLAVETIVRLADQARHRQAAHEEQKRACQVLAKEIQWQLGLSRPVYSTGVIQPEQFLSSLQRLQSLICGPYHNNNNNNNSNHDNNNNNSSSTWQQEQEHKRMLQEGLAGNALAITGSGHFCHLGDDGSVVIPHDWR